ncbi:NAD(P)H-binding protein [Vibrio sp. 404]|uniref:NAD(P)H-binding protein n=1 Tax=Vibrio marinisediminis TaxID=2758441 RepID=A0A7W2FQP7_9VIBR|nr:NAD(P)H-binding protein [Vibrio marinisediminis]MBA5762485.1 NAD(P)H-binding protein [Vibrio marinisediminis]
MKRIGIIGGGWLGLPLGQFFTNLGHYVVITKTTKSGAADVSDQGLTSAIVNLEDSVQQNIDTLTPHQLDTLIGSFPPGFRKGKGEEYAEYWANLIAIAQGLAVSKLIMVSSTTVYPNRADNMSEEMASLALALEADDFSDSAKVMLRAEQKLINSGLDYAIVRCSGLVGPNRNPARFVSHLRQVSDQAPANMLHLTDAIGAVSFATLHVNNQIVNATTPNTTNKAAFYQMAIERSGYDATLPPIVHTADKRICAEKLVELGYKFHFQHTLEII